jgi:hypothetical protein
MKKIIDFINKYGIVIMVPLVVIMFFRTCSTGSKVNNIETKVLSMDKSIKHSVDSMGVIIKIEGLKTESRFIQATDRKILDVNRQNDIEKEIKNYESKLK